MKGTKKNQNEISVYCKCLYKRIIDEAENTYSNSRWNLNFESSFPLPAEPLFC